MMRGAGVTAICWCSVFGGAAPVNLGPCGARGRYGEAPGERLYFLKTVKTASTSLRFAFLRFAARERMALLRGAGDGGELWNAANASDRSWTAAFRPPAPGSRSAPPPYDAVLDHGALDEAALRAHLPGARRFSATRDPVARTVSAIAWFHRGASPAEYFAEAMYERADDRDVWNSVAWSFGVPGAADPTDVERPAAALPAAAAAAALESFDVVAVVERLDASLVAMRSRLCWRWSDMLVPEPPLAPRPPGRRRRARRRRPAARPPPPVSNATLRRRNALDGAIHAAARARLDALAAEYGPAFDADVAFFRRFKFAFATSCLGCLRRRTTDLYRARADCGDLRPSCRELAGHEAALFAPAGDVAARRAGDARADAAVADAVAGCAAFEETRVCNGVLCAVGPLCAAALPARMPPWIRGCEASGTLARLLELWRGRALPPLRAWRGEVGTRRCYGPTPVGPRTLAF